VTTLAYCTNGSTSLAVVDANSGALATTLTMGDQCFNAAVSPNGAAVAVSALLAGWIQFVNTATNVVGSPVTVTPSNPYAMVWAPDSSKVYVFGQGGSTGAVQSVTPLGVLGPVWSFPITSNAGGMCISSDGTKLYCVCGDAVRQIDTTSGTVTGTYYVSVAGDVVITPDGTTLYVSNYKSTGLIWPITIATGTVGTAIAVGSSPLGLAISPDGHTLWSAQQVANHVQSIAVPSGSISTTFTVPYAYELAITLDGSSVVVSDYTDGEIFTINTAALTLSAGTSIGGHGRGLSTQPVGGTVPGPPTGTATVVLGPLTLVSSGTISGTGGATVTGSAVLNLGPVTVIARTSLETVTATSAMLLGPLRVFAISGRAGPGLHPIPGYRGRWRLTLHNRSFHPATLASTIIAELGDARGRQIVQAWNTPATLTFTLDGHSPGAALIQELLHDVVAWRWDDQTGLEQPVFRGPITQSEDQLTTEQHTVTYICHDYAALLTRRLLTGLGPYTVTGRDQDLIVADLLAAAIGAQSSSGVSFSPASFLPLSLLPVNPAGSLRGQSGALRNRTYYGSQNIGEAVDDLAKVIGGFDYDVRPSAVDTTDSLRIFYPAQGVNRTDIALQYGSTVASLTRTVNSADYANYVRVLGNNQSAAPTPQLYAEDWGPTALSTTTPVGLWMVAADAADVTVQSTLNDKASGQLALDTILVPSYTLNLAPDAYTWGNPNMGDTVGLVIQSGRLNVNTFPPSGGVRVLGITYSIGDDGQEDVTLVVARPQLTLKQLLTSADRDVKALARR
jgi:hypothetical protein